MNTHNVLLMLSEARFGSASFHEKQVKRTAQGSLLSFTEANLIQPYRAFKLSEHIAAQLGSIWATSIIG